MSSQPTTGTSELHPVVMREEFTEEVRPTFTPPASSPISYLYHMFSEALLQHIVTETNRYASQVMNTAHGDGHDQLGKVSPVIDAALEACLPSKNVVVDKGRSRMKQYLPMKPVMRGIKVRWLSDSATGYISKYDVYTGGGDGGEKADQTLGA